MIYKRRTALERSVKIFYWRALTNRLYGASASPLVQMWIKTHRHIDHFLCLIIVTQYLYLATVTVESSGVG